MSHVESFEGESKGRFPSRSDRVSGGPLRQWPHARLKSKIDRRVSYSPWNRVAVR